MTLSLTLVIHALTFYLLFTIIEPIKIYAVLATYLLGLFTGLILSPLIKASVEVLIKSKRVLEIEREVEAVREIVCSKETTQNIKNSVSFSPKRESILGGGSPRRKKVKFADFLPPEEAKVP